MNAVIVSGALANKPANGGNAWSRLGWILGFRRLGFDVVFVEQIARASCVDATGAATEPARSVNAAFFSSVMERFGLGASASLLDSSGDCIAGLTLAQVAARMGAGSLLFNLSGHLELPELRSRATCGVYYDDDPGFTQFWQAAGTGGSRLAGHDHYFTLGANIGSPGCMIPTGGLRWRATRPPVVLSEWPAVGPAAAEERFTTVASWRGAYAPVQFGGHTYGVKAHEFRKFLELPRRSGRPFEVALQIHPGDRRDLDALLAHGWRVVDPVAAAGSPGAFRRYVQSSHAEFSVAQGIYVDTQSGWFSDRTVRYLASGRPALVQDTGFSRHLPAGEGLLAFRTMDEAIAGAERIVREYSLHARAARRVAEDYFDSDRVIGSVLAAVGVTRGMGT